MRPCDLGACSHTVRGKEAPRKLVPVFVWWSDHNKETLFCHYLPRYLPISRPLIVYVTEAELHLLAYLPIPTSVIHLALFQYLYSRSQTPSARSHLARPLRRDPSFQTKNRCLHAGVQEFDYPRRRERGFREGTTRPLGLGEDCQKTKPAIPAGPSTKHPLNRPKEVQTTPSHATNLRDGLPAGFARKVLLRRWYPSC